MLAKLLVVLLVVAVCMFQAAAVYPMDVQNSTLPMLLEFGFVETDITAFDGITLKSLYFDSKSESGERNPTVIFISSWGLNKWEYVVPAKDLADKGYTVISYTSRGFWGSGGQINLAGELDMKDVTTVIDWAIANTNADPNRIGLSGISYGGGMSLLGAGHDSRVKSIASMSCWVDLAESFLGQGETIRKEAARVLALSGELLGNVGEDLNELFDDYFSNTNLDYMYSLTYNSSAINFIDRINANGASVFIANAYGDSLFTPNQFPKFFNQLATTNKHIEFAPGDHAGPELSGLFGIPNQAWKRANAWFDHFLKDNLSTPIDSMATVVLDIFDDNSNDVESYNSLDEIFSEYNNFYLDKRESLSLKSISVPGSKNVTMVGDLIKAGEELSSLTTGKTAHINGGIAFVSATVRAVVDFPRHFIMPLIDRLRAGVWISDRVRSTLNIRGIPKMTLSFIPEETAGTLIVYLLDVNSLNEGGLFSYSPITFKGVEAGKVTNLEFEITMTSYNLHKDSRLGVVISSHDILFLDQNEPKSKITFLSGSFLSLPVHN